jgi:FtsP/CotA-like multicopper oxidase with cupredoxin domain
MAKSVVRLRINGEHRLPPKQVLPWYRPCSRTVSRALIFLAAPIFSGMILIQTLPVRAQLIGCPPGEPLVRIPELVSDKGILRATIVLSAEIRRISFSNGCNPQYVRVFRGLAAVLPGYGGLIPPGYPGYVPSPSSPARGSLPTNQYLDPVPPPTLRARVGDIVELTLINNIDSNLFAGVDSAEYGRGCDQTTAGYPGFDIFPNCFHGSTSVNIHFHGIHTNPTSTGDNAFLAIRPSPRPTSGGPPSVTEQTVKASFDTFFSDCEKHLKSNIPSQWPTTWRDLPELWIEEQKKLLQAYDTDKPNVLWPVNQQEINTGLWPQYYIGAFPYCFQLPHYPFPAWPPSGSTLRMGQAPGTHWYYLHKHGSTTVDVESGLTGIFIIEGEYDDVLNGFYGQEWTRTQPLFVINQLGVSPNLLLGSTGFSGGPPFSVNGRLQPKLTMRPSEVQLWRIVNASGRSGAFFVGFRTLAGKPADFTWKQLAQDGIQYADRNYKSSQNQNPLFLMMPGNRVDLLVKAPPATPTGQAQLFNVIVKPTVARSNVESPVALMTVEVAGPPMTGNKAEFIPTAPTFPPFLADITDAEVRNTPKRTLTFNSQPSRHAHQHTINGEQFDDSIAASVLLNTAEEWKIENTTNIETGPSKPIDHPFHIRANPFQVVEVFDPNEMLSGTSTYKYIFEGNIGPGQCLLDINNPEGWRPCTNTASFHNRIWWDVFPIPAAREVIVNNRAAIVPGYFKMRSRFVDYSGAYLLHSQILAHADRGMKMIVEVRRIELPFSPY